MRSLSLVAGLVLASSLSAQAPSAVSPQGAADPAQLGNANNNIPFSWTPTAYQQIHDANSFSNQTVQVWNQMRQRMANTFANLPGQTIDVELFLANAAVSAAGASTVFSANIVAASEVNVFTRKMVNLPQVPNNDWAVAPYPFDVPFVWTVQNLSLRANVYGNSNNNQLFTYPLDAWSSATPGAAVQNGSFAGCQHALGTGAAKLTALIPAPGSNAVFSGDAGYAKAMPAALLLGASNTAWGSINLPIDLTPFNAPGCSIVNDVLTVANGSTDGSGLVSWNIPVPTGAGLEGQIFYSQIAILDAAANALGAYLSNGQRDIIGGPLGITRIWGGISSTGGSIGRAYGMAISFN